MPPHAEMVADEESGGPSIWDVVPTFEEASQLPVTNQTTIGAVDHGPILGGQIVGSPRAGARTIDRARDTGSATYGCET